ncbi:MAG: tetratricopeptide repeat protein, partial [Chloroflexi bacterium]|nr:tetratricopeptide repeat protein [Chloroflexota bacterium]
KAIADATEALGRHPGLVMALVNRAAAYLDKGDGPQALADSNAALRLDSTNVPAYNNRAIALAKMGRTGEAVEDLNKAYALVDNDAMRDHISMVLRKIRDSAR